MYMTRKDDSYIHAQDTQHIYNFYCCKTQKHNRVSRSKTPKMD